MRRLVKKFSAEFWALNTRFGRVQSAIERVYTTLGMAYTWPEKRSHFLDRRWIVASQQFRFSLRRRLEREAKIRG